MPEGLVARLADDQGGEKAESSNAKEERHAET
jgi:hypothetical protein